MEAFPPVGPLCARNKKVKVVGTSIRVLGKAGLKWSRRLHGPSLENS